MAEERKLSSMKRAATANDLHPTVGMFTRGKSEMYLHRNRSGRVRFDSFPLPLSEKRRRTVLRQDSSSSVDGGDDDLSCILIKDLRTKRVFSKGFPMNSCFERKKVEEGSVEESAQSTPPDIDFLVDTKVAEEDGNPNMGSVPEKQSNELDQKSSRIKSFLRPCSRVKLFKAPGSVSYRRLLPFLMDISEENSVSVGGEKMVLEEKALLTSHGHENLMNKPTREIGPAKSDNLDSGNRSNSTPFECIEEPCKAQQFSHALISMVDNWSKPILKGGIEKFNFKNNSVLFSSCDTKLMDTEETENIGVANPENMNNLICGESLALEEKCNSGKDNEDGKRFDDTKQSEIEDVHKFDLGGSSAVSIPNDGDSNLSDGELNESLSNAEQKDDHNGEVLDQIDNTNKDYTPRTSPDGHIFGKPEVAENGGIKKCIHNEDDIPGKPSIGSSHRSNIPDNDKATVSSRRRKQGIKQLSRLKLFRTPGSVSYRRMLPFLKDVAEASSCASRKDHVLKLEKKLEANPPSPSFVSDYQEIPCGNPKGNDCHAAHRTGHCNALPILAADASSNDQEINSKLLKDVNESLNPLNKQPEQDVHFEQDISDTGRKLESGPEIMDINHEIILSGTQLRPHSTSGSFWTKDDKEASSPPSSFSIEEDCSNPAIEVSDDAKPIEADSLHQKSSLHATSFCLNTSTPVFKKGILKRNPRGCRGLCTCLNCSSFRLHAEKAFEFSRNQMQDAEEVCLDLIKELSYIRNMLEKSPFSTDGHALVSGSQIKEVCKRASEVEALAQNRLSEMNFDLNIHCRVTCTQGPRVRFANYVEEKVITKPDLPRKYSGLGKTKRKIMLAEREI
ncbi:hypothetical protein AB3S75_044750 [Citrus x aurantiifolia]